MSKVPPEALIKIIKCAFKKSIKNGSFKGVWLWLPGLLCCYFYTFQCWRMARTKEPVIHCPRAFRSPESISNVPVSHCLYQVAPIAHCSCQRLTWQCQPGLHAVIGTYEGMKFTTKLCCYFCGRQIFLSECTNKPRTCFSFYTDINALLSGVLQKVVKSHMESCGGLPALQLGHMASLCVKVRVRTMCTLSFGEKKVPATDCVWD